MKHLTFPQIICFDWDDTLVDSRSFYHITLNDTLKDFGHTPFSDQMFSRMPPAAWDMIFHDIFTHNASLALKEFKKKINQNHLSFLKPLEGSFQLLAWLKNIVGIPLGVVSNKHGDLLRKEINYLSWETFFTVVIGSGDTPADKPSPQPLQSALHKMGHSPCDGVWFVGDSLLDVLCAKAAGCRPIFVGPSSLRIEPTVLKLKSCLDLHDLLLCLKN